LSSPAGYGLYYDPSQTIAAPVATAKARLPYVPDKATLSEAGVLEILHRWIVAVIGILAAAAVTVIYVGHQSSGPLRDDAQGYYMYLPAIWVYHDLGLNDPRLIHPPWSFHYFAATGNNGDIYQFGVALLCSPLFLLGHYFQIVRGGDSQGYSAPEQLGAIVTAVVMLCIGAWSLKRSLDRRHSGGVVLAAIVCVVFGTSVFDYAVFDSLFSHIFAFGLICALLPLSDAWRDAPGSWRYAALLGLVGGLLTLVRLTDVIFLALPFLYVAFAEPNLGQGLARLWAWRAQAMTIVLVAFGVYLPQLLFIHHSAGYWTANLYLGANFDWLTPHVLD